MNRLFLYGMLVGAAVGASVGCSGGKPDRVEKIATTADGEIHMFDCGPLFLESRSDGAAQAAHEFRIVNHSRTAPMTLRVKSKPCGCTRLDLPEEPTPPGGVAIVQMAVHAPGEEMVRSEHVVLESDQPGVAPIHLDLRFHSMPRLEGTLCPGVDPRKFVVEPGEVTKLTFSALARQAADEPSAEISAVVVGERATVSQPRSWSQKLIETARQSESQFELQIDASNVDVADPDVWRDHEGEVRISHGSRQIAQRFSWRIRSEIEVSPQTVFLHPGERGMAERSVLLKGSEPFEILESAAGPDWLTVVSDSTPHGKIKRLRVAIDAERAHDERLAETTIKLTTNHPRQPALYLPMYILWPGETGGAAD